MRFLYAFALVALLAPSFLAVNDLYVKRPGGYTTKPGYIESAVMVVEPKGGYMEQSLYLTYSDRGGFAGYDNVEIFHRFEIPQGSVVNDLWLWIESNVVRAIIIDTWKGRTVYDSIVNLKRDPAFLTKNNNQYELRVFPLTGGSYRKVKITMITPVKWFNTEAVAELPLKMMQGGYNTQKPLDIYFRCRGTRYGSPAIVELPGMTFSTGFDSVGYRYYKAHGNDVASLTTMRLQYKMDFAQGLYFESREYFKGFNYFQLSFSPKTVFHLNTDSSAKKVLVGMDLSGFFNKNFVELIPNLRTFLKSALAPNYSFNMAITGAGKLKLMAEQYQPATQSGIEEMINNFVNSSFADSVQMNTKPRLFYADIDAPKAWGFTGIDSYAVVKNFTDLTTAAQSFYGADICASYRHAWVTPPSPAQLPVIIAKLDSLFQRGGRFVCYFNMDCNTYETVVRNYIPSLRAVTRVTTNQTLYRDTTGNIGKEFPEYFDHTGNNHLTYSDSLVKVEVKDAQNHPIIVTKKIGNGLLVACGIWLLTDDAGMRKMLSLPILGLNKSRSLQQLPQLLAFAKQHHASHPYDRGIVITNSDSLITKAGAENFASTFTTGFSSLPVFNSVNLLNDSYIQFPSVTVNSVTYCASGYLLKKITELSRGLHYERQLNDWSTINSGLSAYALPTLTDIVYTLKGDGDTAKVSDVFEIKQEPRDPNAPLNFVGATRAIDSVSGVFNAKFRGSDSTRSLSFGSVIYPPTDTTTRTVNTIVGNEKVKVLFRQTPIDTAGIVSLALRHRLLCDYTAFLALEPNDTIHYIDPGSGGTTAMETVSKANTFALSAYPNPFNGQITINVTVPSRSKLSVKIFNVLGQLVQVLADNEEVNGLRIYRWNGSHTAFSSGIYLIQVEMTDMLTNKRSSLSKKIILMK